MAAPGREIFGKAEHHYVFFAEAKPRARLVVPAKPEQEEREAAELVRDMFRRMGGAEMPSSTNPPPPAMAWTFMWGRPALRRALAALLRTWTRTDS